MTMSRSHIQNHLSIESMEELVLRLELLPKLLRRQEEEKITKLVAIESEWIDSKSKDLFADKDENEFLKTRGWTKQDLEMHICLPEALRRFAKQRFGPGVEESFLASQGSRDEVIYSLLRVKDAGLARELWIRLEEGEVTFAEAAQNYSEGAESDRKGVIGPMPIGLLRPPELADCLRALQPGELMPPRVFGEWYILLRLEKLLPARLDTSMRERLLQEKLDTFLKERVGNLLAGKKVEDFYYERGS